MKHVAMVKSITNVLVCSSLPLMLCAQASHAGSVSYYQCREDYCTYSYTLKKDGTHEFRGQCIYDDNEPVAAKYQTCDAVKSVTCTLPFNFANYESCSCTNWSPTQKKTVEFNVSC